MVDIKQNTSDQKQILNRINVDQKKYTNRDPLVNLKQQYVNDYGYPNMFSLDEVNKFKINDIKISLVTPRTEEYSCITQKFTESNITKQPEPKISSHPFATLQIGVKNVVNLWKRCSIVNYTIDIRSFPNDDFASRAITGMLMAARCWNDANVGVTFEYVSNYAQANFILLYNKNKRSGDFAKAFFPSSSFDFMYIYEEGLKQSNQDMLGTFKHELGHVLGLRHEFHETVDATLFGEPNPSSVMGYNKPQNIQKTDIIYTQLLYSITDLQITCHSPSA